MPNHLHGILRITDELIPLKSKSQASSQSSGINSTEPGSIATIIRSFKAACSKSSGHSNVWQRGFYEHVIRSEAALLSLRLYIQNNPIKWHLNELYNEKR
jgi:REP element-mobilizing transposase RayT